MAEINPDLIFHDKDGLPLTVRYDAVNVMLLNEFIKEHKKVEKQQASIADLKSTVALGTERHAGSHCTAQRAGSSNSESERSARSEQARDESSRE